ncbi:MAG: T9SS type A sorting domain-containing protein [Chlorobi bacterium]|nr:T9SS type A sorting domain-containing protein [Chlorobiota bacterium]
MKIVTTVLLIGWIAVASVLELVPCIYAAGSSHTAVTNHSKAALRLAFQATRLSKQLVNDSVRRSSRIVGTSLDVTSDALTIRVEITDSQSWLDVALYNMLGKRVKEVFRGPVQADETSRDFSVNISDLPNGLYIVTVQGPSVRLADKVFISR